jgi:hypothetical protein
MPDGTMQPTMPPRDFIRKWQGGSPAHALNERAGAQAHFIDLCRVLGVPEPADPEAYCFERGVARSGGAGLRTDGFADPRYLATCLLASTASSFGCTGSSCRKTRSSSWHVPTTPPSACCTAVSTNSGRCAWALHWQIARAIPRRPASKPFPSLLA